MFKLLLVCFIAAAALVVAYRVARAAYRILKVKLDAYLLFRGKRVVVCPETRQYVAVEVDAAHAAATATGEEADLRLTSCTRWPERADCDQDCVYQIANAPEDCAVRTLLATFFAGESCALCHKPIGELRWDEHKPALLRLYDRRTFECRELPPETLPFALDAHLPVCWDCHIAESFRREHPELVTDRDSKVLAQV
ncbi:MAG TPA: hypothetical protein VFZ44_20870 [Pyrinomonadaceae bacterium]